MLERGVAGDVAQLQIFADVVAELIDDGAGIQIVGRVRAELYLAVAARGLLVEDVLPAVPRRPEHVHDQAAEVGDLRQVEARNLRQRPESEIGRASRRERVGQYV